MRVTASKASLLSQCQRWARDDIEWRYTSSPAATRGSKFHAAIAAFVETGELLSYDDDIADEMVAAVTWLHGLKLPRTQLDAERAMGWDAASDTAKLYDVTDRGYPKDGLIHGTADLLVWREDGSLLIVDHKTGDGSGAGPQLRMLGLMAARVYNLEEVEVMALEVKPWGVTEVCRETLDAFALSALAGELSELVERIPNAEPTPSNACKELYCPAILACEAGSEGMMQIIPVESLTAPRRFSLADPITTPEHAAWALDVLRLVSAKVDALKDEIKSRVPAEGWMLDDGRVLKETHSTVTYVDKDRAFALAKKLGASPQQLDDCTRSFPRSNGVRLSGGTTKHRTRKTKVA